MIFKSSKETDDMRVLISKIDPTPEIPGRKPSEALFDALNVLKTYGGSDATTVIAELEEFMKRDVALDLEKEINQKIGNVFEFKQRAIPDQPDFANFMQMFSYTAELLGYMTKVARESACDKNDLKYLSSLVNDEMSSPMSANRFDGCVPRVEDCKSNEYVIDLAFREIPKVEFDVMKRGPVALLRANVAVLSKRATELSQVIDQPYEAAEAAFHAERQDKIDRLTKLLENYQNGSGEIDPTIIVSESFTYDDQLIYELSILGAQEISPEKKANLVAIAELEAVHREIDALGAAIIRREPMAINLVFYRRLLGQPVA